MALSGVHLLYESYLLMTFFFGDDIYINCTVGGTRLSSYFDLF